MEYFKLFMGIILLTTFTWVIIRLTRQSRSVVNSIARIDIILGIIAGLFLVITSLGSILS